MPTIQLLGDPNDIGRLWAVMLYPNDARAQEQYLAVQIARKEIIHADEDGLRGATQIHVSLDLLRTLLEAPAYSTLKMEVAERTKRAMLAGMLLSGLYVMDRLNVESEPSVNKAIFALSQFAKITPYGDQTPIPHSEGKIREAWNEFAPVAHLWAALELNRGYPFAPNREALIPPNQEKFLQVAAGLLDFAAKFAPSRGRKVPLIDLARAWAVPEPYSQRPSHLPKKVARQPNRIKEFLRHYRAPRSA